MKKPIAAAALSQALWALARLGAMTCVDLRRWPGASAARADGKLAMLELFVQAQPVGWLWVGAAWGVARAPPVFFDNKFMRRARKTLRVVRTGLRHIPSNDSKGSSRADHD